MFIWMIKAEFMRKYNGNYSWLFRSWCTGVSQGEQKWEEKVNWVHSSQTSPGPELQCVSTKQMLFLYMYLILTMDLGCVTKDWEEQWLCLWSATSVKPQKMVFLFWNISEILTTIWLLSTFLLTWPGCWPVCAAGSEQTRLSWAGRVWCHGCSAAFQVNEPKLVFSGLHFVSHPKPALPGMRTAGRARLTKLWSLRPGCWSC